MKAMVLGIAVILIGIGLALLATISAIDHTY